MLTLSKAGEDDRQSEPTEQPASAAATVPYAPDQTDCEFAAAEMHWLSNPAQDSTDHE